MTEQEKSEIVGLMSDVMQKFATEYIQPQFAALQNDIDTKHNKLKQDIADVRAELKQDIADVRAELKDTRQELKDTRQELKDTRQELKDTRQELKSEIQKIQKNNEVVTQKVDELMSWKRDLTDACNAHPEEALEATG